MISLDNFQWLSASSQWILNELTFSSFDFRNANGKRWNWKSMVFFPLSYRSNPPLMSSHHHKPPEACTERKLLSCSLPTHTYCCHEHTHLQATGKTHLFYSLLMVTSKWPMSLSVAAAWKYLLMRILFLFVVHLWICRPVWLWSPPCFHPSAAAALQLGEDCSDTHQHEQL